MELRDLTRSTRWIRRLLLANIALSAVAWLSGMVEYGLLTDLDNQVFASHAQALDAATANAMRQGTVGLLQIGLFIALIVMIGRWIYFANRNANALTAENLRYSPAWAVGCYFVPIVNLWKPYQAMKEIWQASAVPDAWQTARVPAVLHWWWLFWLLACVLGNAAYQLGQRAETLPALMQANLVMQVADLMDIPLCIAGLILIQRIAGLQQARMPARTRGAPGIV